MGSWRRVGGEQTRHTRRTRSDHWRPDWRVIEMMMKIMLLRRLVLLSRDSVVWRRVIYAASCRYKGRGGAGGGGETAGLCGGLVPIRDQWLHHAVHTIDLNRTVCSCECTHPRAVWRNKWNEASCIGADIETLKTLRGNRSRCPLPRPTRGSGERRELPNWFRGGAHGRKRLFSTFRVSRNAFGERENAVYCNCKDIFIFIHAIAQNTKNRRKKLN